MCLSLIVGSSQRQAYDKGNRRMNPRAELSGSNSGLETTQATRESAPIDRQPAGFARAIQTTQPERGPSLRLDDASQVPNPLASSSPTRLDGLLTNKPSSKQMIMTPRKGRTAPTPVVMTKKKEVLKKNKGAQRCDWIEFNRD